jgi:hypothetical protein
LTVPLCSLDNAVVGLSQLNFTEVIMMTKRSVWGRIGQIGRAACLGAVFAAMVLFGGGAVFAKASVDRGSGQGRNAATVSEGRAKYVFLFIGDGMAMSQISSAEIYATARSSGDIAITRLGFTGLPVSGLTTTYDGDVHHRFGVRDNGHRHGEQDVERGAQHGPRQNPGVQDYRRIRP